MQDGPIAFSDVLSNDSSLLVRYLAAPLDLAPKVWPAACNSSLVTAKVTGADEQSFLFLVSRFSFSSMRPTAPAARTDPGSWSMSRSEAPVNGNLLNTVLIVVLVAAAFITAAMIIWEK
jgi:hypothetical protein